ncbi:MAG: divergent PAP2 family protein [Clostridia bacterium]|nr:divergent PAP2 family protein [Clostridia bacterium]
MEVFRQLFSNSVLLCAAISWIVAQAIKTAIHTALYKHLDWKRIIGSGGMPSSHTAFVASACAMTAIKHGVDSTLFALSFCIAAVVIYDAMGVRRETGRQGEAINRILSEFVMNGKPITEENMKTLVGHSPIEVLGGLIVAAIVVLVMTWID